jgi:hypothetical protein
VRHSRIFVRITHQSCARVHGQTGGVDDALISANAGMFTAHIVQ